MQKKLIWKKIADRETIINNGNITIGQYFYAQLLLNHNFRTKDEIFNRATYIKEFDTIWNFQQKFYPQTLTNENFKKIRNEIIYFQRPLKSQKGLVSVCSFVGYFTKDKQGKEVFAGAKVAPKSSPIAQICKIWESINNITIERNDKKNKIKENLVVSLEQKKAIFEYLDNNENLSETELFKLLNIKKEDGYIANSYIKNKGIQGNITKVAILKCLTDIPEVEKLTSLDLEISEKVNKETGEILLEINANCEEKPLYKLWHIIYSVPEKENIQKILEEKFSIPTTQAKKLSELDLTKGGFGNKSTKMMRKILPYLMQGEGYSVACEKAGFNHSNAETTKQKENKIIAKSLELLTKNALRQPVVEKILNQLIHLYNEISEKYGNPDEIRVELARELKQSKDERRETEKKMGETEKDHKEIKLILVSKNITASHRNIERYKLWREFGEVSPYEPNKKISLQELFSGMYDIEHIIPKALRFDDSFGNKTICPRKYNQDKSNTTAFDYMKNIRNDEDFQGFCKLIEAFYDGKKDPKKKGEPKEVPAEGEKKEKKKANKISRSKYNNLMMTQADMKETFIARQLNETRYISKKAVELLSGVCRNVHVTGGGITAKLRKLWGLEDILQDLQLPKYKKLGRTYEETFTHNGQTHTEEKIMGWSKRDDHRHHAIDALVIATTKQGFIQRINTLNASETRDKMFKAIGNFTYNEKLSGLDKYLASQNPFKNKVEDIKNAIDEILISYKAGKKVATFSKRTITKNGKKEVVQTGIITPRGALSEESVYGKIKIQEKIKVRITVDFDATQVPKIVDKHHKKIILARLAMHQNDPKKAFDKLAKNPIWTDERKEKPLTHIEVWREKEETVIKYKIETITEKDLQYIVDEKVRQIIAERLFAFGGDNKKAFKDLANNPVWFNKEKGIAIKTVRLLAKVTAIVPIVVKDKPNGITYTKYVKPGNNHHVAIYEKLVLDKKTNENKWQKFEHIATFWHCVERKKSGFPVVIQDVKAVWDRVLDKEDDYSQAFMDKLPEKEGNGRFVMSFQENEMFVIGLKTEVLEEALAKNDKRFISKYLYRVQQLASNNYVFRHHLETRLEKKEKPKNGAENNTNDAEYQTEVVSEVKKGEKETESQLFRSSKRFIQITSIGVLEALNPIKVRISRLGEVLGIV